MGTHLRQSGGENECDRKSYDWIDCRECSTSSTRRSDSCRLRQQHEINRRSRQLPSSAADFAESEWNCERSLRVAGASAIQRSAPTRKHRRRVPCSAIATIRSWRHRQLQRNRAGIDDRATPEWGIEHQQSDRSRHAVEASANQCGRQSELSEFEQWRTRSRRSRTHYLQPECRTSQLGILEYESDAG